MGDYTALESVDSNAGLIAAAQPEKSVVEKAPSKKLDSVSVYGTCAAMVSSHSAFSFWLPVRNWRLHFDTLKNTLLQGYGSMVVLTCCPVGAKNVDSVVSCATPSRLCPGVTFFMPPDAIRYARYISVFRLKQHPN